MKPAEEGIGIPYETESTQPRVTSIVITQDNPNPSHEIIIFIDIDNMIFCKLEY